MSYQIVDFHCDLLSYLAHDRTRNDPLNPLSNCSLPQLREGGVILQTLAVFTETQPGSTQEGEKQLSCYQEMLKKYGTTCAPFSAFDPTKKITHFILAVENASALVEEKESLDIGFARLDAQDWLYVSLTWNEENRFGGGNNSHAGLKRDGEHFLDYLSGKKIAIDLSHTSAALAHDILNYIHKKGLDLLPMASHSNFRLIHDHRRNLPDAIAKEIFALGGVVGINFIRAFIGDKPEDFVRHFQHGLSLGGEEALCLGADFFGGIPLPEIDHLKPFFQKNYENSSCYPAFLELLSPSFTPEQIQKIAHENALSFLRRLKN